MYEFNQSDSDGPPDDNFEWRATPDGGTGDDGQAPDGYPPVDEAFLPTDECAGTAPEAAGETSPEAVVDRCRSEVKFGLAEVYSRIINAQSVGEFDVVVPAAGRLSEIVAAFAQEAAADGDAEETGRYVDMAFGMGGADNSEVIATCYAGVTVGNERAFERLTADLQQEKDGLSHHIGYMNAKHPYVSRPAFISPCLNAVVSAAKGRGVAPESWVNQYAVDEGHKWELEVRFLAAAAQEPGSGQAEHQQALDDKLADFIGAPANDTLAFSYTPLALEHAKDPGLRAAFASRALAAAYSGRVPLTQDSFTDLLKVATTVATDPRLATAIPLDAWERLISRDAERLQQQEIATPYDLTECQIDWRIAVKRHEGATPDELIAAIDLQTSQMVAGAPDVGEDEGMVGYYENRAIEKRDSMLQGLAVRAARDDDDAAAAQKYIAGISSSDARRDLTSRMLVDAHTQEWVHALRPDQMTLDFDPVLKLEFDHADELVSADIDTITARALRYIATMSEEDSSMELDFIHTAYHVLAKQDERRQDSGDGSAERRALAFARPVLAAMRAAGEPISHSVYLSDALIAAGDQDEPERAYQAIVGTEGLEPNIRLHLVWWLSKVIKGEV